MNHLEAKIIESLAKKLEKSKATIRKNVSLLAHEYPNVTPNARAQIFAKKYGATVWAKLNEEDRKSLPNIEVQRVRNVVKQIKTKTMRVRIIELIQYDTNDAFRRGHIDEINMAYTHKCYTSVLILCRKVVENMLIDILRKKFPENKKENKELYFDVAQRRFKDFSVILKNFRTKSHEFEMNKKLVERIADIAENLKDKANDSAHSWFHLVRKQKEIDDFDVQNLISLIKKLESSVGL